MEKVFFNGLQILLKMLLTLKEMIQSFKKIKMFQGEHEENDKQFTGQEMIKCRNILQ